MIRVGQMPSEPEGTDSSGAPVTLGDPEGRPHLDMRNMFGVYIRVARVFCGLGSHGDAKRGPFCRRLGPALSCVPLVLALALLLRYIALAGDRKTIDTVNLVIVLAVHVFYVCFTLNSCLADRHLYALFDHMDEYFAEYGSLSFARRLRTFLSVFAVMQVWIEASVLGTYTALVALKKSPFGLLMLYPQEYFSGAAEIVYCFILVMAHFLIVFNIENFTCFYGILCYCFCREFRDVNEALRRITRSRQEPDVVELEKLRRRHEALCGLLQEADGVVSPVTFQVGYALPVVCAMIYAVVRDNPSADLIQISTYMSGTMLGVAASIVGHGVSLNYKIHEPRDYLLKIQLENLSEKTLHIISLFMARVNGPSMGFTVYGLFTIDMSAVLTLVGTLCAYVVVVLQFNTGGGASPGTTTDASLPLNLSTTLSP